MNMYDPDMIQTKTSGYRNLLFDLASQEDEISGIVIGIIRKNGSYGSAWSIPDKAEAPSKLTMIGLLETVKADLAIQDVIGPAGDEAGLAPVDALGLDDAGD